MRKIRVGRPSDIEFLVNAQIAMAKETEGMDLERPTVLRGVRAVLDDQKKGCYYVCEQDENIIACLLTLNEWSDWRNGNVMWIHSVYVKPEFRRQGVYQEMYKTLQSEVTKGNFRGLRLYVDKRNTVAQKTYEALGMNAEHYSLYEWMP
jgi:ribosomal protein S18 acetylase RimI-like enzyme